MTKLESLIEELCPDGVEYRSLGGIGTVTRGSGLPKSDFTETGVGCIHYGQIYTYYNIFAYDTKSFVSHDTSLKLKKVNTGDIIIAVTSENVEDVCKCVAWLGENEIVTGGHTAIFKHNQNPKYIAYWFQTMDFYEQKRRIAHGTKVIEVTPSKLAHVKIPLPPLLIQHEIVRILDNFTELTAELTARRKQYLYYSKYLIDHQPISEHTKLGDLGKWHGGGTPSTQNKRFWDSGTIPWITSKDMIGTVLSRTQDCITPEAINNSTAKLLPKNTVAVVVRSGILRHTLPIVFIPFETTVNQDIKALVPKNGISARYVAYALRANHDELLIKTKKAGGTVESIVMQQFLNYEIPLPSLEIQESIVALLDRFDALTTDISIGLPAEIAARQKQYEYYRDKLLTFKEIEE